MLYPRKTALIPNSGESLVSDDQLVGWDEHMLKYRIVFLEGAIGIGGVGREMELPNYLLAMDSISHEPIKLIITSYGGDLNVVFLMYDTMKMIQSPVLTYGRICCSGAAILLAAGKERYLAPHAKVMLHLPSGTMGGDVRDWEIQHKEMQKYKDKVVDVLMQCGATKDRETILSDIDRDFWLEPEEAIEYGLADAMMTTDDWHSWTSYQAVRRKEVNSDNIFRGS